VKTYNLDDFGHVTSAKVVVSNKVLEEAMPTIDEVRTLAKWTTDMNDLFNTTREQAIMVDDDGGKLFDRSTAMARMAYYGAEQGWTDPQIMAVLVDIDNRWGKYTARRDRETRYLIPLIDRARQKHGYSGSLSDLAMSALLQQQKPVDGTEATKMVWGFDDFINTEFKINWMLEDLFATGGFGLLVAHPGVGKTTLAIQMGAQLALGHEKFLKWNNIGGAKKVLLLSLEMGKPPLNHFLSLIANSYPDKKMLNRNFLVAPFGTPIPLDTEQGQQFLSNLMDEYMPDVLIIDSLQKISSKELTDEQAVKSLIHYLSNIRAKYNTSLLVIHHNRKKPNDAQKKSVELSDVYGSTYIATDADFVMNLHATTQENVAVTMIKNRLGPTPEPFEIHRDEYLTFGMDFDKLQQQFGRGDNGPLNI
jgi:KaiC/GvpD/RAD55 family RecA-like ATPase